MAAVDRVLPWRRHQNVTAEELTPLLSAYRRRHPKAPVAMINRAYETAKEAHRHQLRGSGESYINHPLAVARIVADIGLDEISLAAALLHDAVEDTEITIADVEAGVRCRGRGDRRRRHQARTPAVRLQGGPAGRDDAQDAGGDGPRPARAHHQARRPPAQHAHHRGDAQREAAAHRPGDARHLRAAGPSPRHAGAEAAARRPRRSPRCTRSASPSSTTSSAPVHPSARSTWPRRSPRSAGGCTSSTSRPRSPVAASTCGASTRR